MPDSKDTPKILVVLAALGGVVVLGTIGLIVYQYQRSKADARPHLEFALALANADAEVSQTLSTPLELDQVMGCGGGHISAKKGDAASCSALLSTADGTATLIVSMSRKPGEGWIYDTVKVLKTFDDKAEVSIEVGAAPNAPVLHPFRPLVTFAPAS